MARRKRNICPTCETCEYEESGCPVSRKGGECSNMWQPKQHKVEDGEKIIVLCYECPLADKYGNCPREDVTLISGKCQSYPACQTCNGDKVIDGEFEPDCYGGYTPQIDCPDCGEK